MRTLTKRINAGQVIEYKVEIGGGHDAVTLWPEHVNTIMLWLADDGLLWLEFVDAFGKEHKHLIADAADRDFLREK